MKNIARNNEREFVSADRTEFWCDPKWPDEQVLLKSKTYLGEAFFHEIISHPVPLDMNTLEALRRPSQGA